MKNEVIEVFQKNELALRKLIMGWGPETKNAYNYVMKNYINNKLEPRQYWTVIKHLDAFLDCFIMDQIDCPYGWPTVITQEKEYWFYFNQMKNASEYLAS